MASQPTTSSTCCWKVSASRIPSNAPGRRFLARRLVLAAAACAGLALAAPDRTARGQTPEDDPTTVAWLVAHQPERVRALFDTLNLDRPGLESVRRAVIDGDYPQACSALVSYYRNAPTARWLRRAPPSALSERSDARADAMLQNTFTFYEQTGTVPRTREGGIDWWYDGPRKDPEWGWSLNDLYWFNLLTAAYFKTGRREYIQHLDAAVRDWIIANPMPGRMTRTGHWRGLTTSARARAWMFAFYELQQVGDFSPSSRLLMLSSIVEHAQYLLLFHRRDAHNWTISELEGLATIGAAWPEFDDAPGWRAFALERMGAEMTEQVYPDGAVVELTSIYHRITTEHFEKFMGVFREFGHPLPDSLTVGVQKMWSYLALTLRPDGTTPENNDCDRRDIRDKLLHAARVHNRPDWTWCATNGKSGTAPAAGTSVTFPWAGHAVMRSSWKPDAQWSFFDIGPYGTNHQHRDKLHISVDAFGRALLVDAGRYNYERGRVRDYFTGSASHNVIRIDGGDQKAYAERAQAPLASADYGGDAGWDYARGMFTGGYAGVSGQAIHTRTVVYVRDRFWVVADRIETDRPRAIEALWHFAPDCSLVVEDRSVVTVDPGKGNLRIVPVGGMRWNVAVVRGQEKPSLQGWYSGYYSQKEPAPTAIYTADLPGTTTFTWLLVPARGAAPVASATVLSSRPERVELRVQVDPRESYLITVPMNAWRPTVRREG